MSVHQVITGALNRGENVFAVGSIDGINFTVCAVGADVVILSSTFERIQVIPGSCHDTAERIVRCVNCCPDSGKKVNYRWYETQSLAMDCAVGPVLWNLEGLRLLVCCANSLLLYQHSSLSTLVNNHIPQPNTLQAPVMFNINEEDHETQQPNEVTTSTQPAWECVWSVQMSAPPKFIRYSPDGTLFATCGVNDRMVKIWYQERDSLNKSSSIQFSFTYLQHPLPVCGFEWRKSGRYMSRRCVQNVLLTWCEDNTARLWKETPIISSTLQVNNETALSDKSSFMKNESKSSRMRSARLKMIARLKNVVDDKRKKLNDWRDDSIMSIPPPSPLLPTSSSYADVTNSMPNATAIHFHLTASINAENDCLLVPSMENTLAGQKPFVVHWLNNKELVYAIGAEKLLAEALVANSSNDNNQFSGVNVDGGAMDSTNKTLICYVQDYALLKDASSSLYCVLAMPTGNDNASISSAIMMTTSSSSNAVPPASDPSSQQQQHSSGSGVASSSVQINGSCEDARQTPTLQQATATDSNTSNLTVQPNDHRFGRIPSGASLTETTTSRDSLDLKLEILIKQWHKSNDILFAIHPLDGSLLTWTVEWLDDACRQPTVSFTSRFPSAFPLTDAASLNSYLSTFNPRDPLYVDIIQRNNMNSNEQSLSSTQQQQLSRRTLEQRSSSSSNVLYLLTSHENGSLNLWHLSMDENSYFTTILNISHASRMCGHRFQISQVVAHQVLPLMLTASQFGASNSTSKSTTTENKQNENNGRAELILWRINPVGPLCKNGGVRELARMTSRTSTSFTSIAWIPTILPSCTLGSVCNSPSSCFVASEQGTLQVYQAIVDAAGLLSEIYTSEVHASMHSSIDMSRSSNESSAPTDENSSLMNANRQSNLKETFNVVSTQSTAKPGCVLKLAEISDAQHDPSNLLLLHVFNERLIFGQETEESKKSLANNGVLISNQLKSTKFSERFFIVIVERIGNVARLRMWSLNVSSEQPQPIKNYDVDENEDVPNGSTAKTHDSATPCCRNEAVIPSMAQLILSSQKVCDQELEMPNGVHMLSMVASAGHLPSANLYPACKAPYLLLSSCSDERIRFWKCTQQKKKCVNGTQKWKTVYSWHIWRMISDTLESDLEMDGEIFSVSAAHNGRFACAYMPEGLIKADSMARSIKVGVFECESSGGVEWLREDTIVMPLLKQCVGAQNGVLEAVSGAQRTFEKMRANDLIRIDWVSTEDGAHILTIGVGASIYMYTQVSQGIAQRNIVMMKEHESAYARRRAPLRKASSLAEPERISTRLVRWLCIRYLELNSADGLAPLPTAITWVRDGLLIVGMHSEMRVYNQWNFGTNATIQTGNASSTETEKSKDHSTKKKVTPTNHLQLPVLSISPSHSMLDQLSKKTKADTGSANKQQKLLKEIMHRVISSPRDLQDLLLTSKDEHVLSAVSDEGLFEAARLTSPILPQYHPKQLIELLNLGKTRKVKAILLHVLNCLKQSNVSIPNPLSRAASLRRMSVSDAPATDSTQSNASQNAETSRSATVTMSDLHQFDDVNNLEYEELDGIAPLPLYLLMSADNASAEANEDDPQMAENIDSENQYKTLFDNEPEEDDLDEMLGMSNEDRQSSSRQRSRSNSVCYTGASPGALATTDRVSTIFTARHNRLLTEFLTHTHLPGLSSVDQMHLLAVADTLSHFSADVMDKLAQANAAFQSAQTTSVFGEVNTAAATLGSETVDECGLRFLMAMKQHEYLLLCLPLKQKQILKQKGLSSSNIIWALHSEAETELLNAIPCSHKTQPTWSELRSHGVAWWLKNTSSVRMVVEKLAKSAFQQNQDPMDASLYYMAMKKKNVLTHLFRTVKDQRMADFFAQNFMEERWKKAALKNAFVLMSKQRFEHAAAFFLLAGSLKDAIQTVLSKLHDLQLAMTIIRLYESDYDKQCVLMRDLLCHEVLGVEPSEFDAADRCLIGSEHDPITQSTNACGDPFERSMAFWHLKEYSRAAATLVEEGAKKRFEEQSSATDCSLSDIFNFYSFLRNHPLVVRQRLADAGIQMGSTEEFLAVAKRLGAMVTPAERRLYFRTASAHMANGCPMLALDVLMRLPRFINMVVPGTGALSTLASRNTQQRVDGNTTTMNKGGGETMDWSAPTNVIDSDELKLDWSSDEENADQEGGADKAVESHGAQPNGTVYDNAADGLKRKEGELEEDDGGMIDIVAQHLKFVASIRIMTEEMSTLASGFEVDGGQLRFQLFKWLEKEVEVLKEVCDYQNNVDETAYAALTEEPDDADDLVQQSEQIKVGERFSSTTPIVPLHEALRNDRLDLAIRIRSAIRRRYWLQSNQKLLQPMPVVHSFPLLIASVASCKMFVSSPLHFIENQCSDLILTITEIEEPPQPNNCLAKVYKLYNLCQGLSSCLYQSLCDIGNFNLPLTNQQQQNGALTRHPRLISLNEDVHVTTVPAKWPGVDNLVDLLNRTKDEETPQLRLLLVETFVAITMSLFAYAFTAYDARWLYRLAAHVIDAKQFANIFGGGGEKKFKIIPPVRPPRPSYQPHRPSTISSSTTAPNMVQTDGTREQQNIITSTSDNLSIDSRAFRAKFHARVFGSDSPINLPPGAPSKAISAVSSVRGSSSKQASIASLGASEQVVYRWVPPNKNIVQMFAEKPLVKCKEELGVDYDSDDHQSDLDESLSGDDDSDNDGESDVERREHNNLDGYAWLLMRIALLHQQLYRLRQFIILAGFDPSELPMIAPRIDSVFKLLNSWAQQLDEMLNNYEGGCPTDILPNTTLDNTDNHLGPSLRKYRTLIEPGNTPFEGDDPTALPVRRLWAYLVRQEHLTRIFIRHIFSGKGQIMEQERIRTESAIGADVEQSMVPGAFKLIQREHEPIAAFACSQVKPGCIVVSTTRELQEMDLSTFFDECKNTSGSSWLSNRTELDIALSDIKKDPLKDNDDYQLFLDGGQHSTSANIITPFIVDRSRKALLKSLKRQVGGIRRMDSHPSLPYYLSGSADGSIRLWEWGVPQPLFTPRVAGQYAKVTKVVFSANGNKLAAVDGDGLLCLWQASHGLPIRKPFFNQKCHSKSAADVTFISSSSSVLVTAGWGSGDQNLALWDTLMPQSKAMVHCWTAHSEGASSLVYLPTQQTVVSGGRHGELCIWDIRQRQHRATVKCFEGNAVKCICAEASQPYVVVGSSDGDIKVLSMESIQQPQVLLQLNGEHATRGGFSLRHVATGSIQGVQQLYLDSRIRLFSCGADCSLKCRPLSSFWT
ncbi:unnamed protein product [Anisakis simplex]|uniref:WD_REPEATS_REGION domain-containing protein n=1 Tax=Anisakis simplex TaxID=6269 RepID=A0A158PN49_ANISI|nr:unnamed protein product [Anisakis simplex]